MGTKILILSENDDASVEEVMDWCVQMGAEVVRITEDNAISFDAISLEGGRVEMLFSIEGKSYKNTDFHAIWYRKGLQSFPRPQIAPMSESLQSIHALLSAEAVSIYHGTLQILERSSPHFWGTISVSEPNKAFILFLAMESGLKIPKTVISKLPEKSRDVCTTSEGAITKMLSNPRPIHLEDGQYFHYTVPMDAETVTDCDTYCIPVCVQEKIPVFCEIKVSIVGAKMCAVALFPPSAAWEGSDLRKENARQAVRLSPIILPPAIQSSLYGLLARLKMKMATVDLVMKPDGEFIFLEINPEGEFGYYTDACNGYFEQEIASKLMAG